MRADREVSIALETRYRPAVFFLKRVVFWCCVYMGASFCTGMQNVLVCALQSGFESGSGGGGGATHRRTHTVWMIAELTAAVRGYSSTAVFFSTARQTGGVGRNGKD